MAATARQEDARRNLPRVALHRVRPQWRQPYRGAVSRGRCARKPLRSGKSRLLPAQEVLPKRTAHRSARQREAEPTPNDPSRIRAHAVRLALPGTLPAEPTASAWPRRKTPNARVRARARRRSRDAAAAWRVSRSGCGQAHAVHRVRLAHGPTAPELYPGGIEALRTRWGGRRSRQNKANRGRPRPTTRRLPRLAIGSGCCCATWSSWRVSRRRGAQTRLSSAGRGGSRRASRQRDVP
jgi:hypothetical protein